MRSSISPLALAGSSSTSRRTSQAFKAVVGPLSSAMVTSRVWEPSAISCDAR